MNRASVVAILGSLVLAALVAWIGNAWIEKRIGSAEKKVETVMVLKATQDIPIDTKIDLTAFRLVEIPKADAPPGFLSAPDQVLGKRLKEPVYKDEILIGRRLLDDSAASVLSVTLTPGMRAVAVRVDDIIGVSGFLLPGSHVDVLASSTGGVRTVLQDIKVLTVGQVLKAEGGTLRAGSVTLEVDPRQAEILTEATLTGSVRLALRHQQDRAFFERAPTPEETGEEAAPPVQPSTPPPSEPGAEELIAANIKRMRSITVIKGMTETHTGFQWEVEPAAPISEESKQ